METGSRRIDFLGTATGEDRSLRRVFESTSKISPASLRSVAPRQTLAKLQRCARHVPISRVSNLSPLDRLRLPVFSATTPLARDLTTHLGKGLDAESAQISAMMEAIERVSAETAPCSVRRSFVQIQNETAGAIDPRAFDLPHDTAYDEEVPISWVEAWDLSHMEPVWVPLDLAVAPPQDGVLHNVDTNGLAAGNTMLEAIVHGLCEVIERDALSVRLFRSMYDEAQDSGASSRRVAPDSLPPEARHLIEQIRANRLEVLVDVLQSEIGVPVFRSMIVDYEYPSGLGGRLRQFVGFGSAPDAKLAAIRSVTEAVQSRLAIVQGARDSFNTLAPPWRRSTARLRLREIEATDGVRFDLIQTFVTEDLYEDFQFLMARLAAAGFSRIIVVDLSRPEFGFPVVRVRVPGLASFAVDRTRVGWRCLRYLL